MKVERFLFRSKLSGQEERPALDARLWHWVKVTIAWAAFKGTNKHKISIIRSEVGYYPGCIYSAVVNQRATITFMPP